MNTVPRRATYSLHDYLLLKEYANLKHEYLFHTPHSPGGDG
jgi:hypothetical protein